MAANKFATMLHKNTNKMAMILIYAVLEWTLIVLLLLNSLFSYLIIKFAQYFGLKPPCLWCSRVDHIFEPEKTKNMNRDLICESHAREISKLGFCSNHQKLAESQDLCEDCLSSKPEFSEISKKFTFSRMIQTNEEKVVENGHVSLKCSCCSVNLDSDMYNHIVIKPSWDVLGHTKNMNFINDDHSKEVLNSDRSEVEYCVENKDENVLISDIIFGNENEEMTMKDEAIQLSVGDDDSLEIPPQLLEFFIDCTGHRLVPVELIDSATEEDQRRELAKDKDLGGCYERDSNSCFGFHEEAKNEDVTENGCRGVEENAEHYVHINEESRFSELESIVIEESKKSNPGFEVRKEAKDEDVTEDGCIQVEENAEHSAHMNEESRFEDKKSNSGFHVNEAAKNEDVNEDGCRGVEENAEHSALINEEAAEEQHHHSHVHPVCEDISEASVNETEVEVLTGIEIPDLNTSEEIQTQQVHSSLDAANDHGCIQVQDRTVELHTMSVEVNNHVMSNQSSLCSDLNEIEQDKAVETPKSIDSFNQLHKKLLLLEKKDSGTKDSFDGSVVGELEGGDGVLTIEQLNSALGAERKALQVLYAELEEERNASAIAANQTMAMINRLQEEKAAMQMEAQQYQRMMEEQAEYDQEALQLLNELMVKREKQKEELEKELEVHRKKLLEYETREKLRMSRRSKNGSAGSGFSSPACSHAEDSDAASVDLNQVAKEENSLFSHSECENENENGLVNAVCSLEESIVDFEDERCSILEQLKHLEEKLMTLDHDDQHCFEDVRPIEHHEENGTSLVCIPDVIDSGNNSIDKNGHFNSLENGHSNGFTNGMNGHKGKFLLPLFDSVSDEHGCDSNGFQESITSKFESENKRVSMEEELDHLYERLQALEADKEFLKHCIGSLNKGDKGMLLLHQILTHLRDLRNVELQVRSLNNSASL